MSAFPGVSSYQCSSLGSKFVVIGVVCCQEMRSYALLHKVLRGLAKYFFKKVPVNTYVILNDVNLGRNYGGGREYFDQLYRKLINAEMRKGRFCNDNAKNGYYPRGYPYGADSDGEFPENKNRFRLSPWRKYSPFDTCASAQMLIKKVVKE